MKSDLWIVFAVTAGFLGFIMGYALPPMQEVGLTAFGHGDVVVETTIEDDASKQHYEELNKLME